MGHTSRSMADSGAESNLDCDISAQEVSEKKTISKWSRDHFYDILAKTVVAFCSCLKSCLWLKWRVFDLMALAEKISGQLSIDSVMRLLVVTPMQIYNEREHTK